MGIEKEKGLIFGEDEFFPVTDAIRILVSILNLKLKELAAGIGSEVGNIAVENSVTRDFPVGDFPGIKNNVRSCDCLLYTSPSPRDRG